MFRSGLQCSGYHVQANGVRSIRHICHQETSNTWEPNLDKCNRHANRTEKINNTCSNQQPSKISWSHSSHEKQWIKTELLRLQDNCQWRRLSGKSQYSSWSQGHYGRNNAFYPYILSISLSPCTDIHTHTSLAYHVRLYCGRKLISWKPWKSVGDSLLGRWVGRWKWCYTLFITIPMKARNLSVISLLIYCE